MTELPPKDTLKDPPIAAQDFLGGVRVVDIGDVRVQRGLSRRARSNCPHHQLRYDDRERRVWCADCETNVEPFDAFLSLVQHYDAAWNDIERRDIRVKEAEAFAIRSLAAKAIDKAWRRVDTVPACPHCHNGLFPEDFKNGVRHTLSRDFATARLKKERPS